MQRYIRWFLRARTIFFPTSRLWWSMDRSESKVWIVLFTLSSFSLNQDSLNSPAFVCLFILLFSWLHLVVCIWLFSSPNNLVSPSSSLIRCTHFHKLLIKPLTCFLFFKLQNNSAHLYLAYFLLGPHSKMFSSVLYYAKAKCMLDKFYWPTVGCEKLIACHT